MFRIVVNFHVLFFLHILFTLSISTSEISSENSSEINVMLFNKIQNLTLNLKKFSFFLEQKTSPSPIPTRPSPAKSASPIFSKSHVPCYPNFPLKLKNFYGREIETKIILNFLNFLEPNQFWEPNSIDEELESIFSFDLRKLRLEFIKYSDFR